MNTSTKLAVVRLDGKIVKSGIFLNPSDASKKAKAISEKHGRNKVTCKNEIIPFEWVKMCDMGGKEHLLMGEDNSLDWKIKYNALIKITQIAIDGIVYKCNSIFSY